MPKPMQPICTRSFGETDLAGSSAAAAATSVRLRVEAATPLLWRKLRRLMGMVGRVLQNDTLSAERLGPLQVFIGVGSFRARFRVGGVVVVTGGLQPSRRPQEDWRLQP